MTTEEVELPYHRIVRQMQERIDAAIAELPDEDRTDIEKIDAVAIGLMPYGWEWLITIRGGADLIVVHYDPSREAYQKPSRRLGMPVVL